MQSLLVPLLAITPTGQAALVAGNAILMRLQAPISAPSVAPYWQEIIQLVILNCQSRP